LWNGFWNRGGIPYEAYIRCFSRGVGSVPKTDVFGTLLKEFTPRVGYRS